MSTEDPLTSAAQALATELTRFEQLSSALQREQLTSEKGLKRATKQLEQLAECDTQLAERVQTLVAAVSDARIRQETQAASVQEFASRIQQRTMVLTGLHAQGEVLRQLAAQVTATAQQIAETGNGHAPPGDLRGPLGELREAVRNLAERAEALSESAGQEGFADVARDAESLRVQLLATHNKLGLLEKRFD